MTEKINAILIDASDNVITVKERLTAGDTAVFHQNGTIQKVAVIEDIPKFHKIAIEDIAMKRPVYKYGQLIGEATQEIKKGQHAHDHNIVSPSQKMNQ